MFKIKFVMTKNEGLVEINIYLELDTLVESDSKYVWLCVLYNLCRNYPTLPLKHEIYNDNK